MADATSLRVGTSYPGRADADTASLRQALHAYADLGLGRNLHGDILLARYLALPGFAAIAARLDADRRPLDRSRTVITLVDSTL